VLAESRPAGAENKVTKGFRAGSDHAPSVSASRRHAHRAGVTLIAIAGHASANFRRLGIIRINAPPDGPAASSHGQLIAGMDRAIVAIKAQDDLRGSPIHDPEDITKIVELARRTAQNRPCEPLRLAIPCAEPHAQGSSTMLTCQPEHGLKEAGSLHR